LPAGQRHFIDIQIDGNASCIKLWH
jgi:hypothetical protein